MTLTGATMGASLGLKAFAVAIIGGLTSGVGAIVGGLLLGITETTAGYYIEDYHIFQTTKEEGVMRAVRKQLQASGIPVENSKGEWGPGQEEINVRYADALTMADRHVIMKNAMKEIAHLHGGAHTSPPNLPAPPVNTAPPPVMSLPQSSRSVIVGRRRARAKAASTYTGSLSSVRAWRGVLERERLTVQDVRAVLSHDARAHRAPPMRRPMSLRADHADPQPPRTQSPARGSRPARRGTSGWRPPWPARPP